MREYQAETFKHLGTFSHLDLPGSSLSLGMTLGRRALALENDHDCKISRSRSAHGFSRCLGSLQPLPSVSIEDLRHPHGGVVQTETFQVRRQVFERRRRGRLQRFRRDGFEQALRAHIPSLPFDQLAESTVESDGIIGEGPISCGRIGASFEVQEPFG
jgi:hypothetical protein